MKIRLETSFPSAAQEAAARKIRARMGSGELKSASTVTMPHRVQFLRYRGLKAGRDLDQAAEAGGWRFLVCNADKQIVAAVLTWDDGERWRASSVQTGTWATGTMAALRAGDGALQRDAVVNYLWCRSTWTAALWFRAGGADADRLVNLSMLNGPDAKPQTADDFRTTMRVRLGFM